MICQNQLENMILLCFFLQSTLQPPPPPPASASALALLASNHPGSRLLYEVQQAAKPKETNFSHVLNVSCSYTPGSTCTLVELQGRPWCSRYHCLTVLALSNKIIFFIVYLCVWQQCLNNVFFLLYSYFFIFFIFYLFIAFYLF